MSIQLTLYPQLNEGIYTWDQVVNTTNLLADGSFSYANWYFSSNINNATGPTPHAETLQAVPATSNWKGFKTTGASGYANVSAPSVSGGDLVLPSSTTSITGAYQEATNLVIGIQNNYEIIFETWIRNFYLCRWAACL